MNVKAANEKVYEATIQGNLYQVGWSLLHASLLSLLPIYFYYEFGLESVRFAVVSIIFIYGIQLFAHCFFYLRYREESEGKSLAFNLDTKVITYIFGDEKIQFKAIDIERIETVVSKAKYRGVVRWFPWDSYCYSRLILKTGETFLVTSLMIRELYWPIKLPREKVTVRTFCWI
jgi:hypothetical protein